MYLRCAVRFRFPAASDDWQLDFDLTVNGEQVPFHDEARVRMSGIISEAALRIDRVLRTSDPKQPNMRAAEAPGEVNGRVDGTS